MTINLLKKWKLMISNYDCGCFTIRVTNRNFQFVAGESTISLQPDVRR